MADAQAAPPAAVKGGVVAYLCLDGALNAGAFYKTAFAAEEAYVKPDGKGRTMHLHLYINGSSVMISDPYPEHGHPYVPAAGFNLMLPVQEVDAWWQRAVNAGCTPSMEPQDMFWGDRYAQARDPFGVLWAFVGPKSTAR
ncbi:MAG TPA: VOC family protein [Rhizomicrobium sp.]|nr:VOC family protein [Rhizomicrobium sp.]